MKVLVFFGATAEIEIDDEFIAIAGDNIFNLPQAQEDKMFNDCLSLCDEKVRELYSIPKPKIYCVETADTHELMIEM